MIANSHEQINIHIQQDSNKGSGQVKENIHYDIVWANALLTIISVSVPKHIAIDTNNQRNTLTQR
jgi:hypothetical protein